MFSIEFIDSATSKPSIKINSRKTATGDIRSDHQMIRTELDSVVCHEKITIGSFNERFESPLYCWNRKQYEQQWGSALSRLLAGASKTALMTAMHDPATANFLTWWPLYREGEAVFVQNHLLFLEALTEPFCIVEMDEFVRPHESVDEDGNRISEWSIPLMDIREFVERKKSADASG